MSDEQRDEGIMDNLIRRVASSTAPRPGFAPPEAEAKEPAPDRAAAIEEWRREERARGAHEAPERAVSSFDGGARESAVHGRDPGDLMEGLIQDANRQRLGGGWGRL